MSDEIAKAFGVTPMAKEPKSSSVEKNLEGDFDEARKNILDVIEQQRNAIIELMELSSASQSEKFYDSLNSHIKTFVDANKALLNIRKEAVEIERNKPTTQSTRVTQNNLFVGSTAELTRLIKKINDENKTVDIETIIPKE